MCDLDSLFQTITLRQVNTASISDGDRTSLAALASFGCWQTEGSRQRLNPAAAGGRGRSSGLHISVQHEEGSDGGPVTTRLRSCDTHAWSNVVTPLVFPLPVTSPYALHRLSLPLWSKPSVCKVRRSPFQLALRCLMHMYSCTLPFIYGRLEGLSAALH